MRPSQLPSVAVLLVAAACLPVPGHSADGPGVKTENDLVYTRPDGDELKLDLARPDAGDGPFPAVLVIHGGGWREGDKSQMRGALAEFARRGYVAVSPQYRLVPKAKFPAQVHDVKAAVRWLKAHAKEYRLDPDRIGAVGLSAGGHLALMLGVTGPEDGLEGEAPADAPSTKVRAVVSFAGPTDLAAADIPDASRPLIRDLLGTSPQDDSGKAASASPIHYVSKGDAAVLAFQGTKDTLVPASQATKLADALTAAEVPGRVELILGAGHGLSADELKHAAEAMFAFLESSLKK